MPLKIFAFPAGANTRLQKATIAAAYAGQKLEVADITKVEDWNAYKLNCSPASAAPVLQTEQGYIFESAAILRHIARLGKSQGLYGTTDFEASQIDSWVDYATTELDTHAVPMLLHGIGMRTLEGAALHGTQESFVKAMEGLDNWLETRTFLVGERATIADIAVFVAVEAFLRYAPGANEAYKFKNAIRHYMTMLHQPKVQEGLKAIGHEGMIPAKPKADKPAAAKKEDKPAAAKKEEKPAKEEKDDGLDFDEDGAVQEKKKPNPLDQLPPSTFVLDAFKREYSNNDTRKVAAPYFFEKFDPAGFTCFWANYKYNDENKMPFMTSNLVRGWFQRMDHVRKYGFGCTMIIGEEKKHEISSFWVFRGKGLPQIVTDVDDTELFTWTEIPDIKAEQKKIEDYLAWDGETFANKPVLEGRCFK